MYPFHNLSTSSSLHKIPTHSQSSSPAWLSTLLYFHPCLVPSVLGPPPPSILSSHAPAPPAPVSVPHVPDPVFVPLVTAPVSMPPPISSSIVPLPVNDHPMQTRAKSGISKPKHVHFTKTVPDYLNVEPPSFAIARNIPQWHDAMASKFSAL